MNMLSKVTPWPWEANCRDCGNPTNNPEYGTCSGLGWELKGPPEPMRGQFENAYDAVLCALAPDHALLLAARCAEVAFIDIFGDDESKILIFTRGHAHMALCSLDTFGCPILTPELRAELRKALGI